MPVMLLVIIIHYSGPWLSLINFSSPLAIQLHDLCLNLVPKNSPYKDLNSSLICGSSLYHSTHFSAAKALGVIHLFVVSGFHIHLVQMGLNYILPSSLKTKQLWVSTTLFFYGATCLFHPPILRALVHLHMPYKKRWPSPLTCALSGLTTLTLSPHLWTSLSLQLSWLASLIITTKHLKLRYKLTLVYIGVFLLLSPNEFAHPFTLVLSVPLGFFIGFFMLPLSLISLIYKDITWISDLTWSQFSHFAQLIKQNLQFFNSNFELSTIQKWALIITVNMGLYYWEIYKKRQQAWG